MIVKALLISAVLAALLWLIRTRPGHNRLALARISGLAVACLWILAAIYPDLVTRVANLIGVGRGTDLVLYLLVVAFTFTTVGMYQRLRSLDDRLAEVTRAHALLAHQLEEQPPQPTHRHD